jgi:hypothetical protein
MSDNSLRRIAWGTALLAIVLLIVSAIVLLSAPDPASVAWLANLASSVVALGAPIMGLIIVTRQARNRIAWLWIVYGLLVGVRSLGHGIYYASGAQPVGYSSLELFFLWATEFTNVSTLVFFILLLLWFPDGRPPSRRWRILYIWMALALTVLFLNLFKAGPNWNGGATAGGIVIDNPYGWLPISVTSPINGLGLPAFLSVVLITVLAAVSLVFRYRSAGQDVRQQLRWFVLGGFCSLFMTFGILALRDGKTSIESGLDAVLVVANTAAIVPLYVAVGIAVVRYRLFDIDVVIRKTLLYAALTALLALVYFGSVILLQGLFSQLAGVQQSTLAVVISTLAIAALFTPLRRRIQDWIDRRFYRKKYNAQQVLAQFAQTARDETDLDALLAELVRVVDETLQPEHVSVWLRDIPAPKS